MIDYAQGYLGLSEISRQVTNRIGTPRLHRSLWVHGAVVEPTNVTFSPLIPRVSDLVRFLSRVCTHWGFDIIENRDLAVAYYIGFARTVRRHEPSMCARIIILTYATLNELVQEW